MRINRLMTSGLFLVLMIAVAGGAVAGIVGRQEMPQPNAYHKKLMESVGEWEGTMSFHYPGAPEMPMPCKETVTALGKFWIQTRFECEMPAMEPGGESMNYVGAGQFGYDVITKKATGTWIDNWSGYLSIMKGTMDLEKNRDEMFYEAPDEMGQMQKHRNVIQRKGDSYVMTFYMGEGDAETKIMSISCKRKAKAESK